MNISILILAVAGFLVSLYGYSVEQAFKKNTGYKPACDINDKISCSKAFKSEYGKLFGVTNTLAGMAYYALVFVLALFGFTQWLFYLTAIGVGATVVFAYLLLVKVQSYCLVCVSTYVVNILLLLLSF